MARVCAICNKKAISGNHVSHSHRKTRRRWSPNIQKVSAVVNGAPVTLNVCSRCIRSGKVERRG